MDLDGHCCLFYGICERNHCWSATYWSVSLLHSFCDAFMTGTLFRYGLVFTILLYIWKCLPLLVVPQCIFQIIGLTFYNPFKDKVTFFRKKRIKQVLAQVPLKAVPLLAPFVCFRVVTRGLYPRLVKVPSIPSLIISKITRFTGQSVSQHRHMQEGRHDQFHVRGDHYQHTNRFVILSYLQRLDLGYS